MLPFRRIALLILAFPLLLDAQTVRRRAVARPAVVPRVSHVFLVVLENTDRDVAVGLPFMQRLAAAGAVLTNYRGVAHPSQPNYIAMTAGSTDGVNGDVSVTLDVPHIGDLLEQKGLTWKAYAENYPVDCFLGDTNGTIEQGQYVRRHEPFIEFLDVQRDPDRCRTHIVNANVLDADIVTGALPNFSFYSPDNQHNGHDSSAAAADAWLEQRFGPLLKDQRFVSDMLFIVTWDESRSQLHNDVLTVMTGPSVKPGVASAVSYDHYNLLRTIEAIFATGTLGQHDRDATPVTGIWR